MTRTRRTVGLLKHAHLGSVQALPRLLQQSARWRGLPLSRQHAHSAFTEVNPHATRTNSRVACSGTPWPHMVWSRIWHEDVHRSACVVQTPKFVNPAGWRQEQQGDTWTTWARTDCPTAKWRAGSLTKLSASCGRPARPVSLPPNLAVMQQGAVSPQAIKVSTHCPWCRLRRSCYVSFQLEAHRCTS